MPQRVQKPVPQGMHTITPYLTFNGNCEEATNFYKKVFGAEVAGQVARTPDGKIMHVMLKIGDSHIMLSDSFGGDYTVGTGMHLWVYVDDADQLFDRAVSEGCRGRPLPAPVPGRRGSSGRRWSSGWWG